MYCLNINLEKKKAWVYSRLKDNLVEIGSDGYEWAFKTTIKEFSVELDYEQECTLFILCRNSDGDWIAQKNEYTYFVGKPENITYEKLIEVDEYLLKKRNKSGAFPFFRSIGQFFKRLIN